MLYTFFHILKDLLIKSIFLCIIKVGISLLFKIIKFKDVFILLAATFIDNAKVMSKGQITIPKDVREVLGVNSGDRITFIVENNSVRIVNSAVYAMQMLQAEMQGEAEKSGITSEDDVMELVNELRRE